jgi:hypothetical protein
LTQKLGGLMKYLILTATLFFSSLLWGQVPSLQTGDVLLQPLYCRLCELIESEEQSIYSHMGLVIQRETETFVLESFGSGVKIVTFDEFNKKTQKGQKLRHLRFKDPAQAKYLAETTQTSRLILLYKKKYEGLKYDPDFLWDNYDENGKEKLYCSELVVKILNEIMIWNYPIKRMHFSRNVADWDRHFGGNTPRDQWGNSPADFEKSVEFVHLGDL